MHSIVRAHTLLPLWCARRHTWPGRVCTVPTTTHHPLRVPTRRAVSTPLMMTFATPVTLARARLSRRTQKNFCNARGNGTPSDRVVSVGGPVDSARRRLADSRRRSTSERTGAADSRGSLLPRLASRCHPLCPLVSSPRRALVTPTYSPPRIPLGVPCGVFILTHSTSSFIYVCRCVRASTWVYMCVHVWLQSLTLRCQSPVVSLPPTRLASASELCIPFSPLLSSCMFLCQTCQTTVRRVNLHVGSKMMTIWCLINILV